MILLGILAGFAVMIILSPLPVIGPLIAGFVAGLVAGGGSTRGGIAGFLAGILGGLIIWLFITYLAREYPGLFTGPVGTILRVGIAVLSLYTGVLGLIGGAAGGASRE